MIDFTVAICTYNGEARLPRVLNRLVQQTHIDFSWEVIVVDNNSSDSTAKVIQQYQSTWSICPLRSYFEPQQGLAFARRCAMKHARGELVGFLDDDNLPAPGWVSAAYRFGRIHPQAGAYGSRLRGKYEIEPPANFQQIACFLAVVDRGDQPFRYEARKWLFPSGAGLVVRKQAWQSLPERPALAGVSGHSLASKGEDVETLAHIAKAEWEIWYNPQMCIEHEIPRSRLQREYLLKLLQGVGLSSYQLRKLRFPRWQHPVVIPLYLLNDLRKLAAYYAKHRHLVAEDTVAACQLELYRYRLLSPFYHWSRYPVFQRAIKFWRT
ncbi:MAG: hormogonium polysaccharide biosynthesis glycosyltransferase HpsE [Cyanophyceae cyanobacterium]